MMPRRAERQDGGGGEEEDTTQGQTQEAFAPAPGCPPQPWSGRASELEGLSLPAPTTCSPRRHLARSNGAMTPGAPAPRGDNGLTGPARVYFIHQLEEGS